MQLAYQGVASVFLQPSDGASKLLRNPLERQVVLASLDIKTRLVNVSYFLLMEIERNNMGPDGYF
ncbi:MAG: hypothetical protein QGF29_03215 [Verrucomicrobiota bacterium]|nr:hypothetical protein [Verrucomicrobiota bacterium]